MNLPGIALVLSFSSLRHLNISSFFFFFHFAEKVKNQKREKWERSPALNSKYTSLDEPWDKKLYDDLDNLVFFSPNQWPNCEKHLLSPRSISSHQIAKLEWNS